MQGVEVLRVRRHHHAIKPFGFRWPACGTERGCGRHDLRGGQCFGSVCHIVAEYRFVRMQNHR
jgi:hypothetical protein